MGLLKTRAYMYTIVLVRQHTYSEYHSETASSCWNQMAEWVIQYGGDPNNSNNNYNTNRNYDSNSMQRSLPNTLIKSCCVQQQQEREGARQ